jgi:uracil-DNA glycosylase
MGAIAAWRQRVHVPRARRRTILIFIASTPMPSSAIPSPILHALQLAHPSWQPSLLAGLAAVAERDPAYLPALAADHYLPTEHRLFAAFSQPLERVRYVLVGEGPYQRAASATGVSFMDGAVGELWCENGLSKPVNIATSLRNFMKMLLVAEGSLSADTCNGPAIAPIAASAQADGRILTLAELQDNLTHHGFLLLNAALVFRPHVRPPVEARAWVPFLQVVLATLADRPAPPTLVLWGKIAEQLKKLPETERFPQACAEHPYNLSFIAHAGMQQLFGPMQLLKARRA